jgi:hypothetical protein
MTTTPTPTRTRTPEEASSTICPSCGLATAWSDDPVPLIQRKTRFLVIGSLDGFAFAEPRLALTARLAMSELVAEPAFAGAIMLGCVPTGQELIPVLLAPRSVSAAV